MSQIDYSFLMTVTTRNCYFLQRALDSLRIQFWRNSELVAICDDVGLVDEITEFLETNQMQGRAYLCEPHLSRTLKFNSVVRRAKGRWLIVFDSDDLLPTGAINILDQCLKLFPNSDYFTTDQAHIDTKNRHLLTIQADPRQNTISALRNNFRQKHLWGFKRSELPMFSDALKSDYPCEDYHFFSTMAMKGKVPLCIPFILCCYRRHTMQMTQREQDKIAEMTDSIRNKLDRFLATADPMFLIHQENLCLERLDEQAIMSDKVKNQPSS